MHNDSLKCLDTLSLLHGACQEELIDGVLPRGCGLRLPCVSAQVGEKTKNI